MGHPDQFAKRTFAEETELVTHGAVTWEDPPEIGLVKVQGDGLLLVRDPARLAALAAPWPQAGAHDEILIEIKMPGDHLDPPAVERALLRRQARQVERIESHEPLWLGQEPLWIVAPHVPEVLASIRDVRLTAPGCYHVGPGPFSFLWIAANELPLCEELVPFLVARSGRALEAFGRWVVTRRPVAWVLDMVQWTAMSTTVRRELAQEIARSGDPELRARQRDLAQILLELNPDLQQELANKVRLSQTRANLRRVLDRRKLAVSADEAARIEACTDVATLERWLDAAVTAASSAEALR